MNQQLQVHGPRTRAPHQSTRLHDQLAIWSFETNGLVARNTPDMVGRLLHDRGSTSVQQQVHDQQQFPASLVASCSPLVTQLLVRECDLWVALLVLIMSPKALLSVFSLTCWETEVDPRPRRWVCFCSRFQYFGPL